jgi:hypothetical protein
MGKIIKVNNTTLLSTVAMLLVCMTAVALSEGSTVM